MKRTVILANGEFPRRGGAAWEMLAGAERVVCCDGAAGAYRRRFGRWPTAVVGDFDSIAERGTDAAGRLLAAAERGGCEIVRFPAQDTNDLEKAIRFCAKRGWVTPVIVGATGKREDHAIGNVFRALDCGCEIVTDAGRFIPFNGRKAIKVRKGAAVSVFAPDPATRMTSQGLEWPLDGVRFANLYCATLNRATAARVLLTSTAKVSVFCEF